jgi:putative YhdH/YhfP family quinone oxidoreductase
VAYSSLNYKDALSAVGNKGVTRNYPHTPGIDAAGIVEESAVEHIKPGDNVIVTGFDLGMNTSGGFSEYIRVPAGWVVQCPENLSLRESMVYGTAGLAAGLAVYKLMEHGIDPDSGNVVVTGAPGGVGSVALAILVKSGYHAVAVNGLVDQRDYLLGLGAQEVIRIDEAKDTSGRLLLKERWAGAIDTLGGEILSTAIRSTQHAGTVVCCGNAASPDLPLNVYPFILRGVSLLGVDTQNCPIDLRIKIWNKFADEWKLDYLDQITTEIGLNELSERIDLMLQGKNRGRAILDLAK